MGFDMFEAHRENILQKFINMAFLCHGPLPYPTIPPLLLLSPQNPLDHVSAFIRPQNLYFGDLDLHGPSDILFIV